MKKLSIMAVFMGIMLVGCSPRAESTKSTLATNEETEAVSTSSGVETAEVPLEEDVNKEIGTEQETESSSVVSIVYGEEPFCMELFNKDVVQLEEVRQWSGVALDEETVYVLTNLINYYDYDSIMSYVSMWNTLGSETKNALAVLVGKNVLTADMYEQEGVPVEDLEVILKEMGFND